MAANLNEASPPLALDALRRSMREHGEWPEDRAVTGLLHALELTGGARHRAVATAMALVDGARAASWLDRGRRLLAFGLSMAGGARRRPAAQRFCFASARF